MRPIFQILVIFTVACACTEENTLQPGKEKNLREGGISKDKRLLNAAASTNTIPTQSQESILIQTADLASGSIETSHIKISFAAGAIGLSEDESLAVVTGEASEKPADLDQAFEQLNAQLSLTNTLTYKGGVVLTFITDQGPLVLSEKVEVCKKASFETSEQAKVLFLNPEGVYSLATAEDVRTDAEQGACVQTTTLNGAFFFLGFTSNSTDSTADSSSATDSSATSVSNTDESTSSDSSASDGASASTDSSDSASSSDSSSSTGGSTVVDTTPPSEASLRINSDATITNSTDLDLEFSASDATQLAFAAATDCSNLSDFVDYKTSETGFTVDTSSELTGTIFISVIYQDAAGNKSECVTKSIAYDKEAPSAASITINNGDAKTTASNLSLTFAAAGATQMAYGESPDCSVIGAWQDYSTTAVTYGDFGSAYDNQETEITIGVIYRDAAGNETTCVADSIELDRLAPTVSSFAIAGGAAATTSTSPAASISLADAAQASEMAFAVATDCSSLPAAVAFNASPTLDLGSPSDGDTVSISLQVTDDMGNQSNCITDTIVFDSLYGDLSDDDNSAADFAGGAHDGTEWDGNKLTFDDNQIPATRNLASTWTPQWGNLGVYYPFDGDANDHSGNGHTATQVGTPTSFDSDAKVGSNSASITGSSSYLAIPHHADVKPVRMSISVWANLDDWDAGGQSIISNTEAGGGYAIQATGNLRTWISTDELVYSECDVPMNGVADGQWAHFAITYDGVIQNCYINGVLVATDSGSAEYDIRSTTANSTIIGGEGGSGTTGTGAWLTGKIDDLAIWKSALTTAEVAMIYNVQASKYHHQNLSTLDSSWTPKWDHLKFYAPLDDDFDSTVGSHTGQPDGNTTGSATPVLSEQNKVGSKSVKFDGNDDIEYADHVDFDLPSNQITIATWLIRQTSTGFYESFIAKYGNTSDVQDWLLSITGTNNINFGLYDGVGGSTSLVSDLAINMNEWYHIACTYDGAEQKIYINGELKKTVAHSITINQSTAEVVIGSRKQGGNHLQGFMDEAAIWNTALDANEIKTIYDRQKVTLSATYSSRVVDTWDANSSWSSIEWKSTLPYGKELPGSSTEQAADYSGLSNDFADQLIGLWHFESASITDSSSSPIDPTTLGSIGSGVSINNSGKFNKSVQFDGTSDGYISFGNATDFNIDGSKNFTFSTWFKTTDTDGYTLAAKAFYGDDTTGRWALLDENDGLFCLLQMGSSYGSTSKVTGYSDGNWHHAACRYDYDAKTVDLFVDGQLRVTAEYPTSADVQTASSHLLFGKYNSNANNGDASGAALMLDGQMDEMAIWKRALSDSEINLLYRRGANRTKFQVRSCTAANCSDNPIWKGPDNTASSYFSELYNRGVGSTSNLIADPTYEGAPVMSFDNFTSPVISVENNRYFQYRVILESDDLNSSPDVESVTVRP